jgi:hypothetical protein
MKKIERFLQLFSEFNLIVTEPGKHASVNSNYLEEEHVLSPLVQDLQKSIRKLDREYCAAKRAFKAGRIPREELFDYEWRLFELKEELRKIQGED